MTGRFQIVGIGRQAMSDADFRDQLCEGVAQSAEIKHFKDAEWQSFAPRIRYLAGDFADPDTHLQLAALLDTLPGAGNRLYYLATAPSAAPAIIHGLANAGLNRETNGWARIVIEKPFGRDLASAQALNITVAKAFEEKQVYRIDNWRWAGVPFYLRTGKRLARQVTEIAIHYKHPPLSLFPREEALKSNVIVLRLQPDEGISLAFGAKQPGTERKAVPVSMDFCYRNAFGDNPPSAYAVLLLDAMRGDATLFTRRDGVEAQWRLITPIEDAWAAQGESPLPNYAAGGNGPAEADALLARNGHHWREIDGNAGACNV